MHGVLAITESTIWVNKGKKVIKNKKGICEALNIRCGCSQRGLQNRVQRVQKTDKKGKGGE